MKSNIPMNIVLVPIDFSAGKRVLGAEATLPPLLAARPFCFTLLSHYLAAVEPAPPVAADAIGHSA